MQPPGRSMSLREWRGLPQLAALAENLVVPASQPIRCRPWGWPSKLVGANAGGSVGSQAATTT